MRTTSRRLISVKETGLHSHYRSSSLVHITTGWERTVHVSRCPALYSGRIFCLIMSGIDYFCVLK